VIVQKKEGTVTFFCVLKKISVIAKVQ